eukprot:Phypoly_transcript_07675.p1 GENE.Phypoly_transcript_07675~~Phypoly_transcript_07675.p1  ORF type:complete len:181 (+),score=25.52 Phypoly_transcript_07675:35-577(+)
MSKQVLFALCFIFSLLVISTFAQQECPKAPKYPQDRRNDTSTLTIATYNAEWLFLNRSNCPGSGCPWKNVSEALLHLDQVAAEIREIDADILNVAEVQDCHVLTILNEKLKGMNYLPYLAGQYFHQIKNQKVIRGARHRPFWEKVSIAAITLHMLIPGSCNLHIYRSEKCGKSNGTNGVK